MILGFALALCAPVLVGRVPVASDTFYLWAPWSRLPHEPVRSEVLADSAVHYLSWLVYSREAVADGEWPLWDPYAFSGFPYVANSQNQLYYPLTWLRWLLPLGGAVQLLPIFNICVAGWGMYVLARWLNASRPGSIIAGLAFAGSGMMQLSIEVTWIQSVYCWLPFMLYATDKALQSKAWAWVAVAAVPCGLQAVAGNLQWLLYSYFAIGCWTLWRAGERWRAEGWREAVKTLTKGVLVLVGGLALAAVHLIPFFELISQTTRTQGRASSNSWPISYLLRMIMPEYFNTAVPRLGPPMTFNELWGVGILPILLTPIALVTRSRPYVWFWAAMGLFAVLVTFGIGPFLYVRWLPGLQSLLPMRIGYLLIFSLSLLAGFGYDGWLRIVRERYGVAVWVLLTLAATLGAVIAWAWLGQLAEPNMELSGLKAGQVSRGLLLSALSLAVLAIPLVARSWRALQRATVARVAALVALGVLVVDLLTMVPGYNTFTPEEELIPAAPSVAWLKAQAPGGRVMGVDSAEVTFNPNTQSLYGFGSVNGYDSFHWRRYEEYWGAVDPSVRSQGGSNVYSNVFFRPQAYTSTLASLLNVRYVAAAAELEVPVGWTQVYGGEIAIYENPGVLPRAFVVANATVLPAREVLERTAAPGFEPRNELLLEQEEGPPIFGPSGGGEPGEARVTSYRRNSVTVEVDLSEPSWLVLTDPNYPGWSATVGGREQKVYTAYYLLRAVHLEGGRHTVEFRYWPTWYWPAIVVSAGTATVILFVISFALVRSRYRPDQVPIYKRHSGVVLAVTLSGKEITDMSSSEDAINSQSSGGSKDAPDKDSGSSKTTGTGESGVPQPVQKPSQAEGDPATIDADIRQKEREGKL